jgi:soluble lytic murein transglycosylase
MNPSSSKKIKKINKIKHKALFSKFKYSINKKIKILSSLKAKNIKNFINRCKLQKLNEFNNEIKSFCLTHFLELYISHLKLKNDQRYFYNYLNSNLGFYLKNKKIFLPFLKSRVIKTTIFQKLSKDVGTFINTNNLLFDEDIFLSLDMNMINTDKNINEKSNINLYLNKELKAYYKRTIKYINSKNITSEQLQDYITQLISFTDMNFKYLDKRKVNLYFSSLGKSLKLKSFNTISLNVFNTAYTFLNKTPYYSNVVNNILWFYLLDHNYDKASNFISLINFNPAHKNISDKLLYWVSYIYLKTNKIKNSNIQLNNLIKSKPLSYYSILSQKLLFKFNNNKISNNFFIKKNDTFLSQKSVQNLLKNNLKLSYSFKRLLIFSKLKLHRLLNNEISSIINFPNFNNSKINHTQLISLTSSFLTFNNNYLKSFKLIHSELKTKKINLTKNILKGIYPAPYLKYILKNKTKVDPIIYLSLMRQESAFNPYALSHAGAKGLMQIMPSTANRINRRIKLKYLYNPRVNINLGIKYLNKLIKKYNGNLIYTLAAYNAGENALKRWHKNIFSLKHFNQNSSEDEFEKFTLMIETIPYKETRNYVKLIYRNIFFYKFLLNSKVDTGEKFKNIYDLNFVSVL